MRPSAPNKRRMRSAFELTLRILQKFAAKTRALPRLIFGVGDAKRQGQSIVKSSL
jgi:hypothetical protein